MAPHPAVVAAQKAALDKAKGKTAADNRQEIKDQASAALARLGLSTPSPRNSGYDGSLNEPGATPPSSSITERIARLRRSLSDEKVKNQSSTFQRVKDRVQEGYADLSDGYGNLRGDKVRSSAEQAEFELDRANQRRMRRADRRQKRQEDEEAKDQVKSVPTSGYVLHGDVPSPPTKLGQAREKLLRTGSLFASTVTKAAKALEAKVKKRSPSSKIDQRACSGGGRVAASSYVQRAHLQYDTLTPEAVTGRLQAQNTLRGDGGLWALKARYVAATKAVPGQLRAARDAEDHAARLADTLAQANERFEALKTQENLLRALVEEARRLATAEKPANGLLAAFPAGAPPPAALGSPASSRSPASVGSPAAPRSRASSAASEAAAEPTVAAPAPAAVEEPPPAPEPAAAEPLPPPAPEPAADGAMPSWMAPDPTAEETPVVEPAEAADDAAPVTPDEEDSPAFTDDDEDK
ncbi:unnamed protein product [Pelagomonas calceolata]|uniref:Uncharacterized protein n=2 Tax=Pelagomonas calceolata TaxID=35677 RepID=A0A8J2SQ25_9STRA|nr:unnamed protein product [Pelagomonas calceolata]